MLRTQTEALAKNLKIPMENLRWYAAFHNESHHPHVHLIAYSTVENEGYLTQKGVENLRSSFAKDIFQQDLLCIYERQTEHRDKLRAEARDIVEDLVANINCEIYVNASIQHKLLELADRLSKTKGKKVYGYLKPDVKAIVDSIVEELANDSRIKKLSFASLCDLAAFGLLIGQCIGRWGNFVNGEAHGGATSLPWGMSIDGASPVHPTFLYLSLIHI